VDELRAAGATEVIPETLEAGLMIASQALLQLGVPLARVLRRVQAQRAGHYRQLRELFAGDNLHDSFKADPGADRLHAVKVPPECRLVGLPLSGLPLDGVVVTALVHQGRRQLQPDPATLLQAGDTMVLFGPADALASAEACILR
jgi:monovalent cation:H+ antiporter-2, CPA2 family